MGLRGGEHDDGNAAELRIVADLGQHGAAVFLRHLHVQEDHVGPGHAGEMGLPPQEGQGLLAVAHEAHAARHLALAQGFDRQAGVFQVVFDEEDFHRPADQFVTHHDLLLSRRLSWLPAAMGASSGRIAFLPPSIRLDPK